MKAKIKEITHKVYEGGTDARDITAEAAKGREIVQSAAGYGYDLLLTELVAFYELYKNENEPSQGVFEVIGTAFDMGVNVGYQIANNERGVQ